MVLSKWEQSTSVPKFPATFVSVDGEVIRQAVSRVRNGYFQIFSLRLRVGVCLPVAAFAAGVPALVAGGGGEVLVSRLTLAGSQAGHAVAPSVLRGK